MNKNQTDDHTGEDYARLQAAREIKNNGGNKYKELEARLTNIRTGKLTSDIICYALTNIDSDTDAKSFYKGYVENIRQNPEKYLAEAKNDPEDYAKLEIGMALSLHFTSRKTHNLWKDILD